MTVNTLNQSAEAIITSLMSTPYRSAVSALLDSRHASTEFKQAELERMRKEWIASLTYTSYGKSAQAFAWQLV